MTLGRLDSPRRAPAAALPSLLLAAALAVALSACGGGGGGGGGADPYLLARSFADYTPSVEEFDRRTQYETATGEYDAPYRIGATNKNDTHLGSIGAAHAYARGSTGAGQTVLVVDTGLRETHREFSGSGRVIVGEAFRTPGDMPYEPTDTQKRHGTAVAGIIAGKRGNELAGPNMHGVAFDAHIYFSPLSLAEATGEYVPFDLETFTEDRDRGNAAFYGRVLELAEEGGADIINQSFGISGVISQYSRELVRDRMKHTAATLAQPNVPDAEKKIIVWAAGNQGAATLAGQPGVPAPNDSPDLDSGLGAYFPELRSHIIAVVAVDQERDGGEIAGYSSRCGIAKSFCIAAPGSELLAPLSIGDDRYFEINGTSAAAPVVSGVLAVMRQHFRGQLGNTELVARLFASADKSGVYANSDIYGHGLVDLDRATFPLGTLAVASGADADGDSVPYAGSELRPLGPAAGDALGRALAGREIVALDELGSPFFLGADSWLAEGSPGATAHPGLPPLGGEADTRRFGLAGGTLAVEFAGAGRIGEDRIRRAVYRQAGDGGRELFLVARGQPGRLFGPYRDGRRLAADFDSRPFHSAPHLRFLADGVGVGGLLPLRGDARLSYGAFRGSTRMAGWDEAAGDDNLGALLELSALGDALSFQAGVLDESEAFAGLAPQGAFGKAEGHTWFGGFSAGTGLGASWRARVSAHAGRTDPGLRARGMVREAGPVTTSSFGMSLEGRGVAIARDRIGLSLSQPLRIESGAMSLRLPVARTKERKVVHETVEVGLEPSARTIDIRLDYTRPAGPATVGMALGAERNAGHSRANGDDLYGHISIDLRF